MNNKARPYTSSATIQLTIEVEVGSWSPECTINQAISQGTREASNVIKAALSGEKGLRILDAKCVRLITEQIRVSEKE